MDSLKHLSKSERFTMNKPDFLIKAINKLQTYKLSCDHCDVLVDKVEVIRLIKAMGGSSATIAPVPPASSLIKKLEALRQVAIDGGNPAVLLDKCIRIVERHSSAEYSRGYDVGYLQATQEMLEKQERSSEISVVERGVVQHLVKRELPHLLLGLSQREPEDGGVVTTEAFLQEIENALESCRNQLEAVMLTKPVSVSLESIAIILVNDVRIKCGEKPVDIAYMNSTEQFRNHFLEYIHQVETVLNAAGMPYVD